MERGYYADGENADYMKMPLNPSMFPHPHPEALRRRAEEEARRRAERERAEKEKAERERAEHERAEKERAEKAASRKKRK